MIFISESANSIVGVLLALFATCCFQFPGVLQKEELSKIEAISGNNFTSSIISLIKNKRWLMSQGIAMCGTLPYIISMTIAGPTVVQPLMNFGFIVLVWGASKRLGESLDKWGKSAIAILIIMPVFIALAGVTPSTGEINITNLAIYTVVSVIIGIVLLAFQKKLPMFWAPLIGILFGVGSIYMNITLTSFTETGVSWTTIIYLVLMGIIMLPALFLSQIGLQKNPASVFNPTHQTINNIFALFGGILILGQTVTNWPYYLVGFIFGGIGVFILARYDKDALKVDSLDESDDSDKSTSEISN